MAHPASRSSPINDPGRSFPRRGVQKWGKKEKRTKKERMGKPDGNWRCCGKTRTVFPQQLAKRLLAFRTVPTGSAAIKPQTRRPDISLATKTGHFHLLRTE
jgi:hypothetical protein